MKQLIKKILREAVGVPTGITDAGKNIYEDLMIFWKVIQVMRLMVIQSN